MHECLQRIHAKLGKRMKANCDRTRVDTEPSLRRHERLRSSLRRPRGRPAPRHLHLAPVLCVRRAADMLLATWIFTFFALFVLAYTVHGLLKSRLVTTDGGSGGTTA